MQETAMQPNAQPFIKLIQRNMALLTQFSTSPEVMSQMMANAQSLFQQGRGSSSNAAQANAFGELMQGMLKNYTEFIAELWQGGMAMVAQGQSAMLRKAQETSEIVVSGSDSRQKRAR